MTNIIAKQLQIMQLIYSQGIIKRYNNNNQETYSLIS